MEPKKIGIMVIIVVLVLGAVLFYIRAEFIKDQLSRIQSNDGECIHEGDICPFETINKLTLPTSIAVGVLVIGLLLGIYLIFFEKGYEALEKSQREIVRELKTKERKESEDEKFNIMLKPLAEDERIVLRTVKSQPGITQSTLKYKADLSKSKLSVILSDFEKKGLIKRVQKGKTFQVFLK